MKHLLILLALATTAPRAQTTAAYQVTFTSAWLPDAYPAGYPSTAHFSPLLGAAHASHLSFWAPGRSASAGIQAMAERGTTSPLYSEFSVLDSDPSSFGSGTFEAPWLDSVTLTLTAARPLVTLVTMLAPSPDWFVGLHDVDIRVNGTFPNRAVVEAPAYDAGTDSGATYTAANLATTPRGVVTLLGAAPFVSGRAIGTFTFTRTNPTAGDDAAAADAFALALPNPVRGAATVSLRLGQPQTVRVRVLDALGRTVAVLAQGPQAGGTLALRLDASRLAAGVYTVVAEGESVRAVRRVSVVR